MADRTYAPFGGAIALLNKDIMLACRMARELRLPNSVSSAASAVFEEANASGLGEEDVSAVLRVVLAAAGQT